MALPVSRDAPMTQKQLREYLDTFIHSLDQHDRQILEARLKSLISLFPFNEYEYILMFLRDRSVLSFQEYENIRNAYIAENQYLNLFGLAP